MAFDFPNAPSVGTIFAPASGPTWQWDGNVWLQTVAGTPLDRIVSTPADMSVGFKTTPNRVVFNDNPSLSGTDVAVLDDVGRMALNGATIQTGTRSGLGAIGDISINNAVGGAQSYIFNAYVDTVAGSTWKAINAGWFGDVNFNAPAGQMRLRRSATTLAAGATGVPTDFLVFDPTTGAAFADKLALAGATKPTNSRSSLVTASDISVGGSGAFAWNGYVDTTGPAWKAVGAGYGGYAYLDITNGDITITRSAASVAAGAALAPAVVLTFSQSLGTQFYNELITYKGATNKQIQCESAYISNFKLDATGNFGWYKSSNGLVGGTLTSLMQLDNAGNLSVTNNLTVTGALAASNFTAATATPGSGILATYAATAGNVILRPNGAGSASGQAFVDNTGAVTITGTQATINGSLVLTDVSCTLVGAYAMCMNVGSVAALGADAGIAGSSLQYSNAAGVTVSAVPPGSWRCMGYCGGNATGVANRSTLFKRYV